jgi:hypothetical protein
MRDFGRDLVKGERRDEADHGLRNACGDQNQVRFRKL